MWFFIAIAGYLISALTMVLDKFILEKKITQPLIFVFYASVVVLPIFLFLPFGVTTLSGITDWMLAAVSGVMFALGLWTMYLSFGKSEVSHAGPLIGGVVAVFVLCLSSFFLGEQFSNQFLIAFCFLVAGSFMISHEKSAGKNGWHSGMNWAILSGLLFAVSHVSAKYLYDAYGFFSGLVWSRGALGVFGLFLLFAPSVRAELVKIFSKRQAEETAPKKTGALIIIVNRLSGVIGVLLVQWAIALGSVTIVNALAGLQYALLIIAVFVLSKLFPKILKEEYAKGELIREFAAVLIIGVGMALLI
jgi:drug/metabolite transporter (DMT)-like permease